MAKAGRPTLYDERVKSRLSDIEVYAKSRASNKEIAEMCGVGYSTFTKYVNENEELRATLENARMRGVCEVKKALYERAVGGYVENTKTGFRRDENGDQKEFIEKTRVYVAPDTNAIGMYLRNYDPEWRDKDHISNEFKRLELELKEKAMEMANF